MILWDIKKKIRKNLRKKIVFWCGKFKVEKLAVVDGK